MIDRDFLHPFEVCRSSGPHRWQASSHSVRVVTNSVFNTKPCGGWLASDEALKTNKKPDQRGSRRVNPLPGNGSAVLYRTCFKAKLDLMFATPGNRVR